MWLQVMECSSNLLHFWTFLYIIIDHSCLNYCISTKLSLIICLINTNILICRQASKLWNASWFYFVFCEYCIQQLTNIHVWTVAYPPNFYGLSVLSVYLCWYIDMPDVTTSNGSFPGLIRFFGNFNVWYVILHQTFINFVES